jgi:hypothetical protein
MQQQTCTGNSSVSLFVDIPACDNPNNERPSPQVQPEIYKNKGYFTAPDTNIGYQHRKGSASKPKMTAVIGLKNHFIE